jgi:hypothetical protein
MGQVQPRPDDELSFRVNPFEEHDEKVGILIQMVIGVMNETIAQEGGEAHNDRQRQRDLQGSWEHGFAADL